MMINFRAFYRLGILLWRKRKYPLGYFDLVVFGTDKNVDKLTDCFIDLHRA